MAVVGGVYDRGGLGVDSDGLPCITVSFVTRHMRQVITWENDFLAL